MAGPANFLLQQIAAGAQPRMADAMARGYSQGNALLQMQQAQEDRNALAKIAQARASGGLQAGVQTAGQLGQYDALNQLDNALYGRGRDTTNDAFRERGFQYGVQRDQVGDQRWNKQFSADQDWRNWQKSNARQPKDPMEAFRTRATAAEMLGLKPGSPEHQGYVLTGSLPRPGQGNKPTVDSAKAAGFFIRMRDSENILSNPDIVTSAQSRINKYGNEGIAPLGPLGPTISMPREFQDENYLKFDQAKRDFINAVLRRESGAVISDSEFANAEQQYFPQPGDPPSLIEQKARNRAMAIEGVRMAADPSLQDVQGDISVDAMGGDGEWVDMGNGVRMRRKGK